MALPQKEWNQYPAYTTIAVQEGVYSFKFGVDDGSLNQDIRRVSVDVTFPLVQRDLESVGADGDIFLPLRWCYRAVRSSSVCV